MAAALITPRNVTCPGVDQGKHYSRPMFSRDWGTTLGDLWVGVTWVHHSVRTIDHSVKSLDRSVW